MRKHENKLGLDFDEDEGFTLNINSGGWEMIRSAVTKPLHPRLTYAELTHPDYGTISITYLSPKQKNSLKDGGKEE